MMKHAKHLNPSAALFACKAGSVSSFAVCAVRYFGVLRYYFYYFFCFMLPFKRKLAFREQVTQSGSLLNGEPLLLFLTSTLQIVYSRIWIVYKKDTRRTMGALTYPNEKSKITNIFCRKRRL